MQTDRERQRASPTHSPPPSPPPPPLPGPGPTHPNVTQCPCQRISPISFIILTFIKLSFENRRVNLTRNIDMYTTLLSISSLVYKK